MLTFTETPSDNWVPVLIFALIVGFITLIIGRLAFKKKPAFVFFIPGALSIIAFVLMMIGLTADTIEKFFFLFYGILALMAAGGSLLGAIAAFFLSLKPKRIKKNEACDPFGR